MAGAMLACECVLLWRRPCAVQEKAQQLTASHAAHERLAQQVTTLQAELARAQQACGRQAAAAAAGAREQCVPTVPLCIQASWSAGGKLGTEPACLSDRHVCCRFHSHCSVLRLRLRVGGSLLPS